MPVEIPHTCLGSSDNVDCRVHRGSNLGFSCNETRQSRCRTVARGAWQPESEWLETEGNCDRVQLIKLEKRRRRNHHRNYPNQQRVVWRERERTGDYIPRGRLCCSVAACSVRLIPKWPARSFAGRCLPLPGHSPSLAWGGGSSLLLGRGTWPAVRTAVRSCFT